MGPALQGAAVIRGGQSRPPLRTLSLRASPQTGAAIRFQRGNAALTGRRGRRPLHILSLRASPQTGAAIRFSSARPP